MSEKPLPTKYRINGRSYKPHPAADCFPLLAGTPYRDLVDDIRVNGMAVPILILGDYVLDGRSRLLAAEELRLQHVSLTHLPKDTDAIALVASLNIHRRHLNGKNAHAGRGAIAGALARGVSRQLSRRAGSGCARIAARSRRSRRSAFFLGVSGGAASARARSRSCCHPPVRAVASAQRVVRLSRPSRAVVPRRLRPVGGCCRRSRSGPLFLQQPDPDSADRALLFLLSARVSARSH